MNEAVEGALRQIEARDRIINQHDLTIIEQSLRIMELEQRLDISWADTLTASARADVYSCGSQFRNDDAYVGLWCYPHAMPFDNCQDQKITHLRYQIRQMLERLNESAAYYKEREQRGMFWLTPKDRDEFNDQHVQITRENLQLGKELREAAETNGTLMEEREEARSRIAELEHEANHLRNGYHMMESERDFLAGGLQKALRERDEARAALRNLVNAASGMLWHDNRHVAEARRILGEVEP